MALSVQDIDNVERSTGVLRGSVGDRTWSRNAHGLYSYPRAAPTNPGSIRQTITRGRFAALVARWNDTLTEPEREGWRTAAANAEFAGSSPRRRLDGRGAYMRFNLRREANGLGVIDTPPTVFTGPTFEPFTLTSSASVSTLLVAWRIPQPYQFIPNSWVLIAATPHYPPSIQSFKPPLKQMTAFRANAFSPRAVFWGGSASRNDVTWVRVQIVTGDSRAPFPQLAKVVTGP